MSFISDNLKIQYLVCIENLYILTSPAGTQMQI